MDAVRVRSRVRFASVFEWLIAAAFLVATVVVGLARDERDPRQPAGPGAACRETPRRQHSSRRAVASRVGPGAAVSRRQGGPDRRNSVAVASRLGRAAEIGRQEVDRGSLGERLTRFYEYAGSRFILVFEPFERTAKRAWRLSTCRSRPFGRRLLLELGERGEVLVDLRVAERSLQFDGASGRLLATPGSRVESDSPLA